MILDPDQELQKNFGGWKSKIQKKSSFTDWPLSIVTVFSVKF